MATVLITGGTGLLGKAIGQALIEKGYRVIILSREQGRKSAVANLSYAVWDIAKQTIDKEAISSADYIIHLAGAGVADKRWTKKRKEEIVNSRVQSSKLITHSLETIPNKVKAVVSASAIGWYGADSVNPYPKPFDENYPADKTFLGDTCKKWEESIEPVAASGKRLVKLRIGIVLSNNGGALVEFKKPMQFGIAAILGNGKQIISWIHINDLVQLFIKAIEDDTMSGVYNAVAPAPVSNKQLIIQLAKSRKKFFIPVYVPAFLLKIIMGELSIEVLKSATVSSEKVQRAGFRFRFSTIEEAVNDLK